MVQHWQEHGSQDLLTEVAHVPLACREESRHGTHGPLARSGRYNQIQMKTSAASLALSACSVLIGAAAAQAPTPLPAGPTIRTTASEVLLDLVVRDKHGKAVKNLKPGDLEIYEDGVRQDIKSFRFVGSRELQAQKAGATAVTTPAVTGVSHPLRAVNVICIVFHNIDPTLRPNAIEAVQEFLKNELQPETYIGMFTLDDELSAIYPFTKNRAELAQTVSSAFALHPMDFAQASEAVLTANPTEVIIDVAVNMAAHSATVNLRVAGGEVSRTVIAGADVNTGAGANILRGAQVTERRDFSHLTGMRETDKLITMINLLGSLPGRKSVLFVSTGMVTTGDPDRFQTILNKANQAGLTFYALDVAGLHENSTSRASDLALGQVASVSRTQGNVDTGMGSLGAAKEKSREGDTLNDAVRSSDTQATLRELSEGTGGFMIANTNEFRKPFQTIFDDVESHYEAAYRPTSDKYDGHLRKIVVKPARADLHVESRTGYFAMPDLKGSAPLQPFETLGLAVLNSKEKPHAFDFRSGVFHFRKDGANSQGALVFEIPGASLAATPRPDRGTHVVHASLVALVKDASGQVVDKFSLDAPYEIPDANLQAVRATPLMYTHPLSLAPGRYTVETALLDREAGHASAGSLPFEMPEAGKTIRLSSAMLLQRVEPLTTAPDTSDPLVFQGKRLVPYVGDALTADAKPFLYFVVYPDPSIAEKPKLQVEFQVDGQVLENQTSALPAPDASGAIPLIIHAATHSGNCELKITAIQGSESASEKVAYTIASK